jgi:quercetin dioxygenase-like cupin family protein
VKNRKLDPIEIIPGGAMKIVRESPTSAIVSFKAGSVEPAHHHTFGHDLVVLKGSKRVWNMSKKAKYDLVVGDYLFTPAGDVHRVKYFEDTEFFIKWEGKWDIFFDEEMEVAKSEIEKEAEDGFELVK